MKKVVKKLPSMFRTLAVAVLVAFMGTGVYISAGTSGGQPEDVTLEQLRSGTAQGESGGESYDVYCRDWGYTCSPLGSKECNDDDC